MLAQARAKAGSAGLQAIFNNHPPIAISQCDNLLQERRF